MASNNPSTAKSSNIVQNPTIPGFSVGGGGGGSTQESGSWSGIDNPEALQALMGYLQQQMSGGTADEKAMRAERFKQVDSTRRTLGDYSKSSAFTDAAMLMAQNLRQSMEKQMPVINKAIQGAGTSSNSMAALLSQKLATESAQAAGALGAQQAASYGGISSSLQSVLEALTRADPTNSNALANIFNNLKTSKSYSTATSAPTNPSFSVTPSGGGSSVVNEGASSGNGGVQSGVWYGPGMIPRDQAWIDATANLPQASGGSTGYNNQYGGSAPLTAEELLAINEGPTWGYGD